MKIVMRDGRVLQGTALQIVQAMQSLAFGADDQTLEQYIESVVEKAERFEGVALKITGADDDARSEALVSEMLRTGLAAHRSNGPEPEPSWDFEAYWNVVFGERRSPADVIAEFELKAEGLDEWIGTAEAEAWRVGGEGEMPESWGAHHQRALANLQTAIASGGEA